MKLGDRYEVPFDGDGKANVVFGRAPFAKERSAHDIEAGASARVILWNEKGKSLPDVSRRALRVKFDAGGFTYIHLKTGIEARIEYANNPDLRNFRLEVSPGYVIRVGSLSSDSDNPLQRVTSFVFERGSAGKKGNQVLPAKNSSNGKRYSTHPPRSCGF